VFGTVFIPYFLSASTSGMSLVAWKPKTQIVARRAYGRACPRFPYMVRTAIIGIRPREIESHAKFSIGCTLRGLNGARL